MLPTRKPTTKTMYLQQAPMPILIIGPDSKTTILYTSIVLMIFDYILGAKKNRIMRNMFNLPSEMSRSRISHANIVGFSRLYCSIFETTAGVATFGLEPPINPGGRSVPIDTEKQDQHNAIISDSEIYRSFYGKKTIS